ncbi:putative trans-sialidase [Trypanosoma cruzi]|nr:putative trans-sialidase [Trypanosoma cruzi]
MHPSARSSLGCRTMQTVGGRQCFTAQKTASGSTWEPGKEYQVALMLQEGNKGCMYVDGVIVGSPETIRTPEKRGFEISFFYIGGDEGGSGSNATVTSFFLYDRPLGEDELKLVTKSEGSVCVLRVLLLGLCGPLRGVTRRDPCLQWEQYVPLHEPSGIIDVLLGRTFYFIYFWFEYAFSACAILYLKACSPSRDRTARYSFLFYSICLFFFIYWNILRLAGCL